MGFNNHIIYQVHIKDQNKVIWVKDLRIFEDYKTKALTEFPDYNEDKPPFQDFLSKENDEEEEPKGLTSIYNKGQKASNAKRK